MNYADITLNDPNFIKRYLQRSRFNSALKLYPTIDLPIKVLDFGGGDGELCLRLNSIDGRSNYTCYEPSQNMYQQAQQKLSINDNISLVDSLASINNNTVDMIYSLEVFEHLPKKESEEALTKIYSLLKPGGTFVIGVPNELFLAALYKGLFRMSRRFGQYDAQIKNITKCVVGRPPKTRPIGEISPGKSYHFHHLGFDHRVLAKQLENKFGHCEQVCTPFPIFGTWASPEIYYVVQKPIADDFPR